LTAAREGVHPTSRRCRAGDRAPRGVLIPRVREGAEHMAVGSLVDVVTPQMGVSVSEGTISRWAKQVGDHIEADETIVEISTDKVDTEIPSPASGIVREILANDGDTVPVNTRIAVIAVGDAGGTDAPADTAPPSAADNPEETPATP